MYVKGEIVVASADKTIVIPKDVIISKQRGNSVFVVDKGNYRIQKFDGEGNFRQATNSRSYRYVCLETTAASLRCTRNHAA